MHGMLNRQAALEQLIANALDAIRDDHEAHWLRLILRRGFVGFENLSEAQLHQELELRGLRAQPPADEAELSDETGFDDFDARSEVSGFRPEPSGEPAG